MEGNTLNQKERAFVNALIYLPDLLPEILYYKYSGLIMELVKKGYIVLVDENKAVNMLSNIQVVDKSIVGETVITDDFKSINSWIDDYRNLFPKGRNGGNRPYKGERQNCINKMRWFLASREVSKEDIFSATKSYLNSVDNPSFISCADYFIRKDGVSKLDMELDNYKLGEENLLKDKLL